MYKTIEELKKGDFVYEAKGDDIYKGEVEKVTMYHTVVIVKIKGLYQERGYGYVSGIKGGRCLFDRYGDKLHTSLDDAVRERENRKKEKQFRWVWYHMNELKEEGVKVSISL